MLKAGVVGVGHLGRHHARILAGLPGVKLDSVADRDPGRRFKTAVRLGARSFADFEPMIERVDLVSIVVPTTLHAKVAIPFLEAGVHVLVEKPLAATEEDARAICEAAERSGAVLQVGHIERFNPAIAAAQRVVDDPRYIISDRIAPFTFRSGDIGVVLDLMVHDLDIVLEFVPSEVKTCEAIGLPVLSSTEDLADARMTFENGALADLRTSRVSLAPAVRKTRLFQSDAYVSIDYHHSKVHVYRKKGQDFDAGSIDPHDVKDALALVLERYLEVEQFEMVSESDALTRELSSFVAACRGEHPPVVPGRHGLRAVQAARMIQSRIHAWLINEARRKGMPIPDFLRDHPDARSS